MSSFPLRRSWATRFLWPMVRNGVTAEVRDRTVRIRMGWLGGAEIPVDNIAGLGRMRWPWWGGLGVRLGRRMAAFTTAWGQVATISLVDEMQVRAPLKWTVNRVIISVEDIDGFLDAVAAERGRAAATPANPG